MSKITLPSELLDRIKDAPPNYVPPTWDVLFMRMAYLAATKSKDTKTKIGAFIVGPNNEPISFGFNGICRGVNDNVPCRYERPTKYQYFEHAERNAIYTLPRIGALILPGTKMYTNGTPCADCGRGVIQAGIKEVIVHRPYEQIFSYLYDTWTDSCNTTTEMFGEAGVKVRMIDEYVGMDVYVNGKIINL
jgi:dCMP deaminase